MQSIVPNYLAAKAKALEWVNAGHQNVNIRGMRGKNAGLHIVTARKR